jgi:hypothetical protein
MSLPPILQQQAARAKGFSERWNVEMIVSFSPFASK